MQYVDKSTKEYIMNKSVCHRGFLFRDIDEYHHLDLGTNCVCCDICSAKCDCGSCSINHQPFLLLD